MTDDLGDYYKRVSKKYDTLRLDLDSEVNRHVAWFSEGEYGRKRTLLDLGCGTGRYTKAFLETGYLAIGLDRSESQIEQAITKVPALLCDARRTPFHDDCFSRISFIMSLHQMDRFTMEQSISEARRVLKENGKVWIKTCSHDDIYARPFTDIFPTEIAINISRYPKISDLHSLFERVGLFLMRSETVVDQYSLTGNEIYRRTRARHNTTLHLLPELEFREGLKALRKHYQKESEYQLSHQHTLLEYGCG